MSDVVSVPFAGLNQQAPTGTLSVMDHVAQLRGQQGMSPSQMAQSLDRLQQYCDTLRQQVTLLTQFVTGLQFVPGSGISITGSGLQVTIASTSSISYFTANANANLTLTTTFQDVSGATVTLDKAGIWLVIGSAYMGANNTDGAAQARILVNGSAQTGFIVLHDLTSTVFASVARTWMVTASAGDVVKMQGNIGSGSSGGSLINATHTNLTAILIQAT